MTPARSASNGHLYGAPAAQSPQPLAPTHGYFTISPAHRGRPASPRLSLLTAKKKAKERKKERAT